MRISERIPYREFIAAEIALIEGSENTQETEEDVGHTPTKREKILHFLKKGRDRCLMAALSDKNIFLTGVQLGTDPLSLPPQQRVLALFNFFKLHHHLRQRCTLRTC